MEKFEFFPIKCRTERARQTYKKREEAAGPRHAYREEKKQLKSKVDINFTWFLMLK
jgi:hypothetical protein